MPRTMAAPALGLENETSRIISEMRASIATGEHHWFLALLEAIRNWPLPEERLGDRTYRYLVGGEAFDWLLLAERLCEEFEDLIPEDERDDLLFHGRLPLEIGEDEFSRLLGAKHRAHLNLVYGIRVETALQLAVHDEVHKEHLSRVWENGQVDEETFRRIYGAARPELFAEFHSSRHSERPQYPSADGPNLAKESGGTQAGPTSGRSSSPPNGRQQQAERSVSDGESLSLADLTEFTYWLFKHRLNNADPARVASDTRKGLAHLQRLEAIRRRP